MGKSSIVNLLADKDIADTSPNATGCTFENKDFPVVINGQEYRLWDTAGLSEGNEGKVPHKEAVRQLYRLLKKLDGGISLLLFVIRAPRMRDSAPYNWRIFYEIICQKKVPIIVVVTGAELEQLDMDDWWLRNKVHFERKDMQPHGYACIVATKGKQKRNGSYMFEEEYEESKRKLTKVIEARCLLDPWKYTGVDWFQEVIEVSYETRWCRDAIEHKEKRIVPATGVVQLKERCGLNQQEAEILGKVFEAVDSLNESPLIRDNKDTRGW